MKAVHHISVSSAETEGAFNTEFDIVNLHRPTWSWGPPGSGPTPRIPATPASPAGSCTAAAGPAHRPAHPAHRVFAAGESPAGAPAAAPGAGIAGTPRAAAAEAAVAAAAAEAAAGASPAAGTGTRGLHSSTIQLNLSRFGHTSPCPPVPCLIDWGEMIHPTYPTKCAYVEPKSGRV